MHPGNIFVAIDAANHGKYIALDFGIMGTLSERDKSYLAQNFLAFFRRDYHRVATAHIESGWVPADTRVDELEAEIRVVLEPIFDRPLKEISLGKVLLSLFRASRRFNVEIQPQLVLLQKTLLNVEGLGRQLDPDLDLWVTAKPFLERWMHDRIGLPALQRRLLAEAPYIVAALPELPRLIHQRLTAPPLVSDEAVKDSPRHSARATGSLPPWRSCWRRSRDCCSGNCTRASPPACARIRRRFSYSRKARRWRSGNPERHAPLRRFRGRRRRQPRDRGRRVLHPARALRLRQDDAAAHDRAASTCRTAGSILLDGEDLADRPPEARPVRTVFQSYALFPHMTVAGQRRLPAQDGEDAAGARSPPRSPRRWPTCA